MMFGKPRTKGGREVLFDCPECGKDRLYVNSNSGLWFCQKCHYKGSVFRTKAERLAASSSIVRTTVLPPSLEQVDADRIRPHDAAYKYLVRRGFTPEQLTAFDVRASHFKGTIECIEVDEAGDIVDTVEKWVNLRRRAIFPIYDDGYRGYQTRAIDEVEKKYRWISAPGTKRAELLFNADIAFAPEHDTIYVAEGIPAACVFGAPGVATFGKGFSDEQVNRLSAAPQEKIYIAYDGDARLEAHALAAKLLEVGKLVWIVPFADETPEHKAEDPDSVEDVWEHVRRAEQTNYGRAMLKSREGKSAFSAMWKRSQARSRRRR